MPSQFFGLSIAGSGLRNANAALNTTANNISNVQTEGYSRQEVTSQAANALRTFTTYGCAGAGVETLAIERVRDSFYDVKYRNNNSNLGQYESKAYYMQTIEDYFNDDGSTGFVTVFNKMSECLQSITTNSSSTSTKAQFVASAESLTDYFNGLYGNLQELQKDINLEIKQCVDEINSISEQIATLSKQINVIELTGSTANDLRDQRDLLVDTLSEYVDVDVQETPIYDTNDPTRETGGTRYVVKIAGGQILVDSSDYSKLKCVAREDYEKINQTDVSGLYKIYWDTDNTSTKDANDVSGLTEFNLNNASLSGKLKGLIEMRDGNNSSNFSATVKEVNADQFADSTSDTYEVTLGSANITSMVSINLPESGQIKIGNAMYSYDNWKYDESTGEYTFLINKDHSDSSKAPSVGSTAQNQDAIKYQGIPYYMSQMNSFIRSFFKSVNNAFENGTDAYGNLGTDLFTVELVSGDELTQEQLETKDTSKMYAGADATGTYGKSGYYWMTAGNVTISKEMLDDADRLGTRTDATYGVEECGTVENVIEMLSNKNVYSFRNASANQMLELILSDVALNASNANTYETTFEGMKNSIDNQRTSISGVDEDEEAVNLVKYQNSYTLASKMIQTLTEIYDQLILNTGV